MAYILGKLIEPRHAVGARRTSTSVPAIRVPLATQFSGMRRRDLGRIYEMGEVDDRLDIAGKGHPESRADSRD